MLAYISHENFPTIFFAEACKLAFPKRNREEFCLEITDFLKMAPHRPGGSKYKVSMLFVIVQSNIKNHSLSESGKKCVFIVCARWLLNTC